MDIKEFALQYEKMCFAFDKECKEGQMLVYYEYLGKYKINAFKHAVNTLILSNTFFPKIGELVDIMRNYKEPVVDRKMLAANDDIPDAEDAQEYIRQAKEVISKSDNFLKDCDVLPF